MTIPLPESIGASRNEDELAQLFPLGRENIADDAVGSDQIADDSVDTQHLADDAVEQAQMADNSVGNPQLTDDSVKKAELDYEVVPVIVSAGNPSGTGTATAGGQIIGYHPTANQDQFVDNITLITTTVTVTLAANATADNTFNVVLLKA